MNLSKFFIDLKLVEDAISTLVDLRAVEQVDIVEVIDNNAKLTLTAFGIQLAKLPLDCRIGKMLLLGIFLGVFNPVVTIVAAFSCKNPFYRCNFGY